MTSTQATDSLPIELQIAAIIEAKLDEKRISRKAVFDRAGLSRSSFDRSMAGGRSFSVGELIGMARALGVHVSDLMPRELKQKEMVPA